MLRLHTIIIIVIIVIVFFLSSPVAQAVYDRRTQNQKKSQAMALARSMAEEESSGCTPCEGQLASTSKQQQREFKPGQFVAVLQEESTLKSPVFFIGRILYYRNNSDEIELLWYKNVRGGDYKLTFEEIPWVEKEEKLTLVKMSPSKKLVDQYRLDTAPRTIHKTAVSYK